MVNATIVVKGKKLKYGYRDDNVIVLNGLFDRLIFIRYDLVSTAREISCNEKMKIVLYGYDIRVVTTQDDKIIVIAGNIFRYDILDDKDRFDTIHYLTDDDFK